MEQRIEARVLFEGRCSQCGQPESDCQCWRCNECGQWFPKDHPQARGQMGVVCSPCGVRIVRREAREEVKQHLDNANALARQCQQATGAEKQRLHDECVQAVAMAAHVHVERALRAAMVMAVADPQVFNVVTESDGAQIIGHAFMGAACEAAIQGVMIPAATGQKAGVNRCFGWLLACFMGRMVEVGMVSEVIEAIIMETKGFAPVLLAALRGFKLVYDF